MSLSVPGTSGIASAPEPTARAAARSEVERRPGHHRRRPVVRHARRDPPGPDQRVGRERAQQRFANSSSDTPGSGSPRAAHSAARSSGFSHRPSLTCDRSTRRDSVHQVLQRLVRRADVGHDLDDVGEAAEVLPQRRVGGRRGRDQLAAPCTRNSAFGPGHSRSTRVQRVAVVAGEHAEALQVLQRPGELRVGPRREPGRLRAGTAPTPPGRQRARWPDRAARARGRAAGRGTRRAGRPRAPARRASRRRSPGPRTARSSTRAAARPPRRRATHAAR